MGLSSASSETIPRGKREKTRQARAFTFCTVREGGALETPKELNEEIHDRGVMISERGKKTGKKQIGIR